MTELVADQDAGIELAPESFWGVVLRRSRYGIAVALAAFLFYSLGWMVAAPPADMAGVSLLAWTGAGQSMVAALGILAILIPATFLCMLLVHPDSPHMGLFCALLGVAGLSIRGGTVHLLLQDAILRNAYPRAAHLLAAECLEWAGLFFVAEVVARGLHDRFFSNTRWLNRTGVDLSRTLRRVPVEGAAIGIAISVAKSIGTLRIPRPMAIVLAILTNGVLATIFLYSFLQTPEKGQVLFACFAAFLIATHLTFYAFPKVPAFVFFLTVPLTAAAGYWFTADYVPSYPGTAGLFFGRALPIDFIAAGIPGSILGYYFALHWDLNSRIPDGEAV